MRIYPQYPPFRQQTPKPHKRVRYIGRTAVGNGTIPATVSLNPYRKSREVFPHKRPGAVFVIPMAAFADIEPAAIRRAGDVVYMPQFLVG